MNSARDQVAGSRKHFEAPETKALHAMSELDFGLRGLVLMLPRMISQQPNAAVAHVLRASGSMSNMLRSGLRGFAGTHGLGVASRACEDIDALLNEVRGKQVKIKYGRVQPSAVFFPLLDLWKALLLRWGALIDTSNAFLDRSALEPVMALYEEAKRMEAVLVDAIVEKHSSPSLS